MTGGGNSSSNDHLRVLAWMVRDDVAALELLDAPCPSDATADPIPATPIYNNDQMRLILTVDDRHAQLNAAVTLDEHRNLMATVNLSDEQQQFTAQSRWIEDMIRGGRRAAGPQPHPRLTDSPVTQHVPDRRPPGPS